MPASHVDQLPQYIGRSEGWSPRRLPHWLVNFVHYDLVLGVSLNGEDLAAVCEEAAVYEEEERASRNSLLFCAARRATVSPFNPIGVC
jgi:hypothetical protein